MTLRSRILAIVGALTLLFVATVVALQVRALRASVQEETMAANRVANQLLDRTAWLYAAQGAPAMQAFLEGLGRIRSNDVALYDAQDRLLYQSPRATYKAGRSAPAWFSALIAPPPLHRQIRFPDGRLEVQAEASRAVLDAWDDLLQLVGLGVVLLVATQILAFWAVGRAVSPFSRIVGALKALQDGQLDTRLSLLPGREARTLGLAFNRMADELQQRIAAERRAALAERALSDSRELAHWLQQHIEAERRMIARELHDELGQSVTAMRSMATSIAQRCAGRDPGSEQAARLIADEAARLYDAMHGLIPRLTPLVLDRFGLVEALADLAERTRRSQSALKLDVHLALGEAPLSPDAALTLYRAAQEGITNALRHGRATHIALDLRRDEQGLTLSVADDGVGPPTGANAPTLTGEALDASPAAAGADADRVHHGLRSLAERAQMLGGRLSLSAGHRADRGHGASTHPSSGPRAENGPAPGSGAELRLWLPLQVALPPMDRADTRQALHPDPLNPTSP